MRFHSSGSLLSAFENSGVYYKAPPNLNNWWNFGFMALFFLLAQIVTGVSLAMFYDPTVLWAFTSVLYLNNDVYYGWWLRSFHANGASFFFAVVYVHMARSLYYGSFAFPRQWLWVTGVAILLLMVVTAFMGYVLPWGQMSYWAAMVITSLFYSLPLIGGDLIHLVWGGFTIADVTLHRFYSLHFALPFVILSLSAVHIAMLHEAGSNNPIGVYGRTDDIPFSPYYILKDTISFVFIIFLLFSIVYSTPDLLGHPDNYIRANFLVTPNHIVPEWYFLPLYAVLRSVVSKLLGIFLLLNVFLVLFMLPFYLTIIVRSTSFKPFNAFFLWGFFFICLCLGWIGGLPVVEPYVIMGLFFTICYFFVLLVCFPLAAKLDRYIYDGYVYAKAYAPKIGLQQGPTIKVLTIKDCIIEDWMTWRWKTKEPRRARDFF